MARILEAHLADDTLDDEQAEVIFKEHLRGVYRPNIRSIITVRELVVYYQSLDNFNIRLKRTVSF